MASPPARAHVLCSVTLTALHLCLIQPVTALGAWPTNPAQNVPICTAPGNQVEPHLVTDGENGAIIVWTDMRDSSVTRADIYGQRVLSNGSVDPAWPVGGRAIATSISSDFGPRIVSDGDGGAIVVWSSSGNVYAHHLLSNGDLDPAWSVVPVCTATANQFFPRLISDGSGGAIVAWEDGRGVNWDIYAQHLRSNGTVDPVWPLNGRAVITGSAWQTRARLVSDGAGGAIIAASDDSIFVHHVRSTGTLDPAWPPGGVCFPVTLLGPHEEDPDIVSDGSGGAILTWRELSGSSLAQHILASGSIDPSWPSSGVMFAPSSGIPNLEHTVSDGAGGALVTWWANNDVYAQRILAGGSVDPSWHGPVRLTAAYDVQSNPKAVDDESGGVFVAWLDHRNDPTGQTLVTDIYGQRVLLSGDRPAGWPSDGLPVCSAPDNQNSVEATADGEGLICVWQDGRSGTGFDIYAQRIPISGLVTDIPVSVSPPVESMMSASPNPVQSVAEIRLSVPEGRASVTIYDCLGRRIRNLHQGVLSAGRHVLIWDGSDDIGRRQSNGVYFVFLETPGGHVTQRMVLLH